MSRAVLDASALLAILFKESGAENVIGHLPGSLLSAVNFSETVTKAVDAGMALEEARFVVSSFPCDIVPFDGEHAYVAAELAGSYPFLGAFPGRPGLSGSGSKHRMSSRYGGSEMGSVRCRRRGDSDSLTAEVEMGNELVLVDGKQASRLPRLKPSCRSWSSGQGVRHASPGRNSSTPSTTTRTRRKRTWRRCGGSWPGPRGRGSSWPASRRAWSASISSAWAARPPSGTCTCRRYAASSTGWCSGMSCSSTRRRR